MSHYKPPHGSLDIFFSGSKEADRKIRENRIYHDNYVAGKGKRDGSRSR